MVYILTTLALRAASSSFMQVHTLNLKVVFWHIVALDTIPAEAKDFISLPKGSSVLYFKVATSISRRNERRI